ncbi:MAG: ribbon-helix-helix domain-containing protein [Pseudomonadota bacterium]
MAQTPGRPRKRSLTIRGHRTSVSLEDPFWDAFVQIAAAQGRAKAALAADIDAARGLGCGLATAIRLYVLRWYQDRLADQSERGEGLQKPEGHVGE